MGPNGQPGTRPILLVEGIALILFGILALFIPITHHVRNSIISRSGFFSARNSGPVRVLPIVSAAGISPAPFRGCAEYNRRTWFVGEAIERRHFARRVFVVCFALGGVAELTYPLARSRYLSGYRGWSLASGVVDLVLAGLMFVDLPETALSAPGLLLGANMVLGVLRSS